MASRCTEVSPLCPVEYTTLGYYPNKPLNIFCAVAFGLALVIQLVIGIWKKTYAFTGFIVAGCALEVAGAYLFYIVVDVATTVKGRPPALWSTSPQSAISKEGDDATTLRCSFTHVIVYSLGGIVREMQPH